MARIVQSVTDLIGDTPLVRLNRLVPEDSAEIYVKLEYQNPGASVKDRIAISMIEVAEQEGSLNQATLSLSLRAVIQESV